MNKETIPAVWLEPLVSKYGSHEYLTIHEDAK